MLIQRFTVWGDAWNFQLNNHNLNHQKIAFKSSQPHCKQNNSSDPTLRKVHTSKVILFERLYTFVHSLDRLDNIAYKRYRGVHTDIDRIICRKGGQILSCIRKVCQKKFFCSDFISLLHVLSKSCLHSFNPGMHVSGHVNFRNDFNMAVVCVAKNVFVITNSVKAGTQSTFSASRSVLGDNTFVFG